MLFNFGNLIRYNSKIVTTAWHKDPLPLMLPLLIYSIKVMERLECFSFIRNEIMLAQSCNNESRQIRMPAGKYDCRPPPPDDLDWLSEYFTYHGKSAPR